MNGVAVLNSLGFSEPLKRIIGQAYAFVVYVGTTWWIRELCRSDLGFLPEKCAFRGFPCPATTLALITVAVLKWDNPSPALDRESAG